MASIIWNKGEQSVCDGWLGGGGSAAAYLSPQIVPSGSGTVGSWGLGLGTRVGGVGSTKADVLAQILEVGVTTANGYARQAMLRNQTLWPASTLSGSYSTTGTQQTFTFTGAPNPNSATLWFIAGKNTINEDNILFGADTAATRIFANGDTEKVTPTYKQT